MYIVVDGLGFSAAHRLIHHTGKCKHFHGHNYKVVAQFYAGDVNHDTGMAIDFGVLKDIVKKCCDELDHLSILNVEDKHYIDFLKSQSDKVVIMGNEPTCEVIAKYLFQKVSKAIEEAQPEESEFMTVLAELTLFETDKYSVTIDLNDVD